MSDEDEYYDEYFDDGILWLDDGEAIVRTFFSLPSSFSTNTAGLITVYKAPV